MPSAARLRASGRFCYHTHLADKAAAPREGANTWRSRPLGEGCAAFQSHAWQAGSRNQEP